MKKEKHFRFRYCYFCVEVILMEVLLEKAMMRCVEETHRSSYFLQDQKFPYFLVDVLPPRHNILLPHHHKHLVNHHHRLLHYFRFLDFFCSAIMTMKENCWYYYSSHLQKKVKTKMMNLL